MFENWPQIKATFQRCFCSQLTSNWEVGESHFLDSFINFAQSTHKLVIISYIESRGGVEDTRLEAKDTKKIRGQGQGQLFRGQTLSRPRTGMLEAKAKDQGHKVQVLSKKKKKKRSSQKFFRRSQKKKKGLHKNFSNDLHEKTLSKKLFNRSTKF